MEANNMSNAGKEYWDIYTRDRAKTGRLHLRSEKMQEGEYHMVVHVCIFNSNNEMLIQQRQPYKEGWPNMWDLTVGGSALAGESSSQAAERELYEELGLKIDLSDAAPDFTITFPNGFDDYYLIWQDINQSEIVLNEEEVKTVKWASKDEILGMYEEGTFIPYWFLDKLFELKDWHDKYRNLDNIKVCYASESNLNSWMSLIQIVKDDFPGLETEEKLDDYRATVKKSIDRQTAICALFGNMVVGFILFSTKHNMLCHMAVHPEFRRMHIATRMFELMLEKADKTRPVVVETFREEDEKGAAPRAFYKKMGFTEGELTSFDGYPVQRFYLYMKV